MLPKLEATRPLRWSKYAITFKSSDHLKCVATAGALPMLCSPVISNAVITKTLIKGGAWLNVLSVKTFNRLQVPYHQLQPTKPFSGVTDGSTYPIGQICLPVTFGESDNYHTELIDFDVTDIRLPYNTILGYPTLAMFMAATHHGYNVLKIPGSSDIITIAYKEKDAMCSLEYAYQAAAVENPEDKGSVLPPEVAPKTKKLQLGQGSHDKVSLDSAALSLTSLDGAPSPIA